MRRGLLIGSGVEAHLYGRLDDETGLRDVLIGDVKRAHRRKALQPSRLPIGVAAIDGKTIWCGRKQVDDPACMVLGEDTRPWPPFGDCRHAEAS